MSQRCAATDIRLTANLTEAILSRVTATYEKSWTVQAGFTLDRWRVKPKRRLGKVYRTTELMGVRLPAWLRI